MTRALADKDLELLINQLSRLWPDQQDHSLVAKLVQALDSRYQLNRKITREPGVEEVILQMVGRLAKSFGRISDVQNKKILDIACGSNTSKLPASLLINTPFGRKSIDRASEGYTALFEPWFCRILFELSAEPVGVDFGDLESEVFIHYRVDLGVPGALDFLPDRSFDGVQDSRLFGSPEFTALFPHQADRLKVAREIEQQELRVLKKGGILIHSDAAALLD